MEKTQKQINKKRQQIEAKIKKAYEALSELRKECNHSGDLVYKLDGNTGNWDKSEDSYWINWICNDCGKRWTTSQDDIYNLTNKVYPNAKEIL